MRPPLVNYGWNRIETAPLDEDIALQVTDGRTGHVMPIIAARRMYSPIAIRPIPTDRAIPRSLAPQAYSGVKLLEPSASTISCRASDLQLCESQKEEIAQIGPPTIAPRLAPSTGWPPLFVGRFAWDSAPCM
jgi:hypothetical protein